MKKKNFLVLSLFPLIIIILSFLVSAVGTNQVHLVTPDDDIWWPTVSNYTKGFTFYWNDTGDLSYNNS